jgi:ParB family transcriptional regulator, chromosome partitioning protein
MRKKIIVREPSEHFKRKSLVSSEIKESLLSENILKSIRYINIEDLVPYSKQARIHFNEEKIDELANSIKEYGIRTPLTVIESDNYQGKFEVVSGERRLRAAKIVALDKVPCLIIETFRDAEAIALIENIQRENLHPIEMGKAFKKLKEEFDINQEEVAKRLNISKSIVSEYIKFSSICNQAAFMLIENKIGNTKQLRDILKIESDEEQIKQVESICLNNGRKRKAEIIRAYLLDGKLVIESNITKFPKEVINNLFVELEKQKN